MALDAARGRWRVNNGESTSMSPLGGLCICDHIPELFNNTRTSSKSEILEAASLGQPAWSRAWPPPRQASKVDAGTA